MPATTRPLPTKPLWVTLSGHKSWMIKQVGACRGHRDNSAGIAAVAGDEYTSQASGRGSRVQPTTVDEAAKDT
ncbi:hypothetical protein GCM10027517_23970 [Phycicoccus ginsengisoli]